ncbi:MAG TPA: hotdog domain-containing protein [Candidatus Binatia bacterium]|nr:hotdog domain-containing protein [Candidatus Binatia bacterium]
MAEARDPTLRVTMLPRDTNARGTIFGGVILSYIDLAGAIAASRHAARNFVTRAMHEVGFIAPVYVGDVVSFYTSVAREGKTSVAIQVSVEAERARQPQERVRVTEAEVVYVAVDDRGRATPIR